MNHRKQESQLGVSHLTNQPTKSGGMVLEPPPRSRPTNIRRRSRDLSTGYTEFNTNTVNWEAIAIDPRARKDASRRVELNIVSGEEEVE